MKYKVLVTGGAGFIGSHIVDALVQEGHDVTIFDNLEPQVHQGKRPDYINPNARLVVGDVTDFNALRKEVLESDVIFHEAAMVGVGQSMYQISRYTKTNEIGTANLLDILVNENHGVKKVVVAASMSSYGEGAYTCENCGPVHFKSRSEEQMKAKQFEPLCNCGRKLKPMPTPETKPQDCNSVYAINKKAQEDMILCVGKAYGIPSVALRYFNVFGPRQSLSNPYTGVAAIFMSRIKNNNKPLIFEDGMQTRDFVSVHDIAQANILAMKKSSADYESLNVGTGSPTSIITIAKVLAQLYEKNIEPQIANKYRKGDIRHCYADIRKIKKLLEYEPKVKFEDGMKELIQWSANAESKDMVDKATSELSRKGLIV